MEGSCQWFATAAMAGEKKGERETDFFFEGKRSGQGAVPREFAARRIATETTTCGDVSQILRERNLTSAQRVIEADTTQANTSEKIVSQRMPCGNAQPGSL